MIIIILICSILLISIVIHFYKNYENELMKFITIKTEYERMDN